MEQCPEVVVCCVITFVKGSLFSGVMVRQTRYHLIVCAASHRISWVSFSNILITHDTFKFNATLPFFCVYIKFWEKGPNTDICLCYSEILWFMFIPVQCTLYQNLYTLLIQCQVFHKTKQTDRETKKMSLF